jgi:hypothetical protein
MSKTAQTPSISKEEITYLERSLSGLPTSKSDSAGTGDADGLLKFGYHQNPYLRTYTKVLWSGYAIARGQLVDGHQRFSQARRDAQMSAVDALTTKALDDAAAALEAAMAPDATIGSFLVVLRDKTLQRLWSRVCETSNLPPPRFHVILGKQPAVTAADLDAEEEAELAALRLKPAAAAAAEDDDETDDDGDEGDDGDEDGDGGATALQIKVERRGGAETVAELVLSAAAEALKELRVKRGGGSLTVTLQIAAQGSSSERKPDEGGRSAGRRRRRRR